MLRREITPELDKIPEAFHPLFENARVYSSNSSLSARVILIDKDRGYFLKTAPKGMLLREAELTRFFNQKGLAPEVLAHLSDERDWLLTVRAVGEDCTYRPYLKEPKKLCDTLAECLKMLHNTDYEGCPYDDHTEHYLKIAEHGHSAGRYDTSLFPYDAPFKSAAETWDFVQSKKHLLEKNTLLHGDYCLPNIILNDGKFSAFIDVGHGGIGDRHVDLFWGIWSLWFNLDSNEYATRFIDAYGRDNVDLERLLLIAACEVFG